MISIDGSYLEGGGQILRTSLALSALTGKAFKITDIRKGRSKPGLKPQHLNAVNAVQRLCDADVSGGEPNSSELTFIPKRLNTEDISVDIGTAGSVTLLMQSLLIPAIFGGKGITITLKGGTDVKWSQPYDYFSNIFLKYVEPFAEVNTELIRRGYYPKGGGEVRVKFGPKLRFSLDQDIRTEIERIQRGMPAMSLESPGSLKAVEGVSHASSKLKGVPERQAKGARNHLESLNCPVSIRTEYSDSRCPGTGITLYAIFSHGEDPEHVWPVLIGGSSLGERGKKAEKVGKEAASRLLKETESSAPVDKYLADQLIPLMPFLPSARYKASEITPHCRTNIHVTEKFLPVKFQVDERLVRCDIR